MPPLAYDPGSYWETRLSRRVDLSTVGHLGRGRAYNQWLYRARRRALWALLDRLGVSVGGKRIFEAGCGSGAYVEFWQRGGAAELVGTDLTRASVDHLRRRYPSYRFEVWDVTQPPGRHGHFDVVTAFDVLFHIADDRLWERALRHLESLVSPGGWLLLSDGLGSETAESAAHVRYRPLSDYERALGDLTIAQLQPIFVTMQEPMNHPADHSWATRAWPLINRTVGVLGRREATQWLNHLPGALLYAIDGLLLRGTTRGPSIHFLTARAG